MTYIDWSGNEQEDPELDAMRAEARLAEQECNSLLEVACSFADAPQENSTEQVPLKELPRHWQEAFSGIIDHPEFVELSYIVGLTSVRIKPVETTALPDWAPEEQESPVPETCYLCKTTVPYFLLADGEALLPKCAYCYQVVCPLHCFTDETGYLCCVDPRCQGYAEREDEED